MCVSPQRRAIFGHLNLKKCSEHEVFCTFWLTNVRFATAACNFSTSQLEKVLRSWGVLYILTCKCAFRHSGVQFFDISTSKSAPKLRCFVHFDLQMCVSPQRRAIFRHLNFKKCSETVSFLRFSLANVRFATAACNFCFLSKTLTSAPAALTGLLFDWPDPRIIEKTQHFASSLTFRACASSFIELSDYCIFCRLTWRRLTWLLYCFSTLHIVGSFYLNFLWWCVEKKKPAPITRILSWGLKNSEKNEFWIEINAINACYTGDNPLKIGGVRIISHNL